MSDLKKVISIELDDNTKTGLDNIDQTFKDVDNSIEGAIKTSANLRLELRQLQKDLLSGKFTGEEFEQATRKAGELKDTIGDLNSRINTLSSDTKDLDALVSAATGIAAGFSIAQGAAGLLGDENEELQQSILKVQSAMAILNGLTELQNLLQKESRVSIALTTVAQKIDNFVKYGSVTATEAQTAATVQATIATKALRTALIATGIGAIVVLVAALASAWMDFSDATEEAKKQQDALNTSIESNKELMELDLNQIDFETKLAVIRAKKRGDTEKEIAKIMLEGINRRIVLNQEELNRLEATDPGKRSEKQMERISELRTAILEANQQGQLLVAEFELTLIEKERKKQADGIANSKKAEEQRKKDFEKEKAETIANGEAIQASLNSIAQKRLDKEQEYKDQADAILRGVRESNETPAQKLEREYKENLAILERAHANTLTLTAKFITDKKALEDNAAAETKAKQQEELERQQIVTDAKIGLRNAELDATIAAFNIAAGFAKKGSDLQKALIIAEKAATIAKIIMNTMAANQADTFYAATLGPVAGPAYKAAKLATNYTQMGIGIATTIAAAAQALSSMGGGSAGGGGSTGGGAAAPPAQFNVVGQSSTNQLAGTIANRQQQPLRAYVVGNDVSTQQELDRNRIQNSTFL